MEKFTFEDLYKDKFKKIPCHPGVYFVKADKDFKPEFIDPGTGGFFKCKDPDVSLKILHDNFITEAETLYIGQSKNLQGRIALYALFGKGHPVSHWGGRCIWQFKDAMNKLYICWEEYSDPKDQEKKEIEKFKEEFNGRLPFANLIHAKK